MKTLILLVSLLLAGNLVPYGRADGVTTADKKKYKPAVVAVALKLMPVWAVLDKPDGPIGPKALDEVVATLDKISVADCPKDVRDAHFELQKAALIMSQALKSGDHAKLEQAVQQFSHAREEYAITSSAYIKLE